jgi:phosphoribosylglycinamide formyltransferase-1
MKRLAIFASGTGTNAIRLLEAAAELENIRIVSLIVDTKSSPLPGIVRERFPETQVSVILPETGLPALERKLRHEGQILSQLEACGVEWILLAGYMRILGPTLLEAYPERIVNIHPSLLPLFPGVDSYRRAFEAGVTESGVTIHLVDQGVDTGPILLQQKFLRLPQDTLESFTQRGKELEWKLYPEILRKLNESAALRPGV